MLFQNILVPYAGSECSLRAFKIAVEIAKKFNSKLTVLTVVPSTYHTNSLYANVRYEEILLKKQRDSANSALSKVDSIAKKQGINLAKYILESNAVVKKIVSFAKSSKFHCDYMQKEAEENIGTKKTSQIIQAYRKYAENYDFAVKLYHLLGIKIGKYRKMTVGALELSKGVTMKLVLYFTTRIERFACLNTFSTVLK